MNSTKGTEVVIKESHSLDAGKTGIITAITHPWGWLGDHRPVYTVRFGDGSGRGFVSEDLLFDGI